MRTSTWHGGWVQTCTDEAGFSQQIKMKLLFFFWGGGGTDLIRTKGIGTQRRAKNPNTVDAHLGFSAVYILLANNYEEKGVSKRRA